MKAMLVHNYYQEPGGEDVCFVDEAGLLESRGHEVFRFTLHNDELRGMRGLKMARKTIFNRAVYRQLRELIRRRRPDVIHCHNTFPLISPAAYYAARAEGVPVVQTLSNYRLFCPSGPLLRKGRVCELCMRAKWPWPSMWHACYRGNRGATAVVAGMLTIHRVLRTWTRMVDYYVALTDFSRRKFIEGGFPAERIGVKPNVVQPDPGLGEGRGGYAVYAGRLSPEKGVDTLLAAWQLLTDPLPLKIVGDGPLAPDVQAAARRDPRIQWLGYKSLAELMTILGDARLLVFPSTCYETFGRTVVEAYAKGTPVVVSDGGAAAELVEEGRTGFLFESGNPADLVAGIRRFPASSAAMARMRQAARRAYEAKYTAEHCYQRLMSIYEQASAAHQRRMGQEPALSILSEVPLHP